jgi:two-component system, cell cycle sensor histidine kinase and response regulator CckA
MQSTPQTATPTVLVVDDNTMVRKLTCQMLRKAGYAVLAAEDSEHALELVATHPEPIDLLLTDIVMPKVGGLELAHRCQELRPDLEVLFVSGYGDDATVKVGVLDPGYAFLQKPFTYDELADKVDRLLVSALLA